MNQNIYIISTSIDTMQTQKEINVKNKKESDLIEIIEEIGMAETNAYLLYGEPQVGKTRLALKLAEIYSDLGFTPKFIVTEVNWGMKFGGKSMLELVRQKFGADSVYIPRNIENILTLEVPNKPFLVFDSLGSVIYDIITNAMQHGRHPLSITPYAIQLSNSIVYRLVALTSSKGGLALFITHTTSEIGRKYRGQVDKRPAFSSRALHALTGIYYMYIDNDGRRKLRIISHRFDKNLEGKEVDIEDLFD